MRSVPFPRLGATLRITGLALGAALWVACADSPDSPVGIQGPGPDAAIGATGLGRPIQAKELGPAIRAQERHTNELLGMAGIAGTAVGLDRGGRPAVKVYTTRRGVRGIPRNLDGIPVVVEVTGPIVALQEKARKKCATPPCKGGGGGGGGTAIDPTARFTRPVPIGVSTGHPSITAGTIGARVTDGTNVFALSNNHVYAATNAATIGDAVIQPGSFDGGVSPGDDIGTLFDFQLIDFSVGAENRIDAAIALSSIADLGNATPSDGYGAPRSVTFAPAVGMRVSKYGRTTGQTNGRIDAINATVSVNYGAPGVALFTGQIVIKPGRFSAGGDSGSLIVVQKGEDAGKPVGLLFAGSTLVTIANPIDEVLARFGVTIDGN